MAMQFTGGLPGQARLLLQVGGCLSSCDPAQSLLDPDKSSSCLQTATAAPSPALWLSWVAIAAPSPADLQPLPQPVFPLLFVLASTLGKREYAMYQLHITDQSASHPHLGSCGLRLLTKKKLPPALPV